MSAAGPRTGTLAMCAILKNEARHVLEWIAYHRVIGVEKFFLYDNNSTDDVAALLAPLVAAGIVSYIPWPINPGQVEAYTHHIDASWDDFEWTAFLDLDEFIHYSGAGTLVEWLGSLDDVSAASIHWINFGPSGNDAPPEGLMLAAYDRRLPDGARVHAHVKTIVRSRSFVRPYTPHAFDVVGGIVDEHRQPVRRQEDGDYSIQTPFRYGDVVINHYYTRSREEWLAKVSRGMADSAVGAPNRRSMEWFDQYLRDAIVEDRRIMRHLPAVTEEIARLHALPRAEGAGAPDDGARGPAPGRLIATSHGTVLVRDAIGRLGHGAGPDAALRAPDRGGVETALHALARGLRVTWLGGDTFLAARNGRFLCAKPDGTVSIDRAVASDWEVFRLLPDERGS